MCWDAGEVQAAGLGAEQDGTLDLYAAHADMLLDRVDHDPLARAVAAVAGELVDGLTDPVEQLGG